MSRVHFHSQSPELLQQAIVVERTPETEALCDAMGMGRIRELAQLTRVQRFSRSGDTIHVFPPAAIPTSATRQLKQQGVKVVTIHTAPIKPRQ